VPSHLQLKQLLLDAGFHESTAIGRSAAFVGCLEALGNSRDLQAWWVPGRIEVLGKHTDYAGGNSLLCATDLGAAFVAGRRNDQTVTVLDRRSGEQAEFQVGSELETETGEWTNYPKTVARRLSANFGSLQGADIVFESNIPLAAGMSSSSVLVVAFATVLMDLNDISSRPEYLENISGLESLSEYLGTIENGQTFGTLVGDQGVGTFGGSEDHTAICCSSPGHLKQYAFCPVKHVETIPFPEQYGFVVASSGVVAEKTGAALADYNRASLLARETARVLSDTSGGDYRHLADAMRDGDLVHLRGVLSSAVYPDGFRKEDLLDRLNQFAAESTDFIPRAAQALRAEDMVGFGAAVSESQAMGARLLKNQVEQTEWLAGEAERLGAITASAFGAGFGGSVYAIVSLDALEAFREAWSESYRSKYPSQASDSAFATTLPGPSAFKLKLA